MSSAVSVDFAGSVLVGDDCPRMCELMRASLECLGYSVQPVDSGRAAPDVIVLDVEMPGSDGMAIGRALRSSERTAAAVISMHSSVAEEMVRAGFHEYDAYVTKSANFRLLGEQVDQLVRSRRTANDAQILFRKLDNPSRTDW